VAPVDEPDPSVAAATIPPPEPVVAAHAAADEGDVVASRETAADVLAERGASSQTPPRRAETRHTVFSARYRLTLKGMDRGKWECEVVAEADAPLVTVDAVVRGVRQRSGEQSDAERVSGDALRQLALQPA
jgi:hypothetical protein